MPSSTSMFMRNAFLVSIDPPGKENELTDSVKDERKLLSDLPNALGYNRIIETAVGGYLVRQYIHSSLYDRLR